MTATYDKHLDLSFKGNCALAKALGYKFDGGAKAWLAPEEGLPKAKVLECNATFSLVSFDESDDVVFVCHYDELEQAKSSSWWRAYKPRWNPEKKQWICVGLRKQLFADSYETETPKKKVSDADYSLWDAKISQENLTDAGIKTALFDYQIRGADKMLSQKMLINGAEMGQGKSLMALAALMLVRKENPFTKCMIICPASLKLNWRAEIMKHTQINPKNIYLIGMPKNFRQCSVGDAEILIVNYEMVGKLPKEKHFNVVICDEAHALKNMSAQRTQNAGVFLKMAEYRWLLTGTPIKNRVSEFWQLLEFVGGEVGSFYFFANQYAHKVQRFINGRTIVKYEGMRNVDELREIVLPKYIRFAKDAIKLPDLNFFRATVEISKECESEIKEILKDLSEQKLVEAMMGGSLSKSEIPFATIKSLIALAKAESSAEKALEIIDQDEGPVVVFSDHRRSSMKIVEILQKEGKKVALIMGDTPAEKRQETVEKFQKGELDCLVGTIGAMSTGVTLTAAHHLIFNDLSYVPADNLQAQKRIHRIGATESCFIHTLVCDLTYLSLPDFDKIVNDMIEEKMKVITKITL